MNQKIRWAIAAVLPLAVITQSACSDSDTPAESVVPTDASAMADNSAPAEDSLQTNESTQADTAAAADVSASKDGSADVLTVADLPPLPDDKAFEHNPYRGNKIAIQVGSSLYGLNCARCHGLQAISGGFTPDLREVPFEWDAYFINRVRNGYKSKMPAFEDVLTQEEIWAIKSYLDERRYEYLGKDLSELYAMAGSEQDKGGKGDGGSPSSGGE